ncbi:MAG: alkaline phosphatase family protein [Pyrinomonadaceae bacterium]
MASTNQRRVLAIGIDAAEPSLVRRFIERAELPALKRLLDEGTWSAVTSPSDIGSGAVWPTFLTGTDPAHHGIYGEWRWQPESMSLSRYNSNGLAPFWAELDARGLTVGLLDVPFAPVVGLSKGFEISEWGAHDILEGRTVVQPHAINEAVVKQFGLHPFASGHPDAAGPQDERALTKLSAACLAGVQLRGGLAARLISETRPDLSIIVFTELHTASHYLWHTVAPEHPFYNGDGRSKTDTVAPAMLDILREIDHQIARLVEVAGAGATVLVFSLHGMRPARGIPAILDPLLSEWGFAHLSGWSAQTWPERARTMFAAAKRHTPASIKKLYYGAMSQSVTRQLAQTTMLPQYDWSRTRAFSLPTDQHGWIRLNVAGREGKGIERPERYDETCSHLSDLLRALKTHDGRAVVRSIVQPSRASVGAPPRQLPDLVVHWDDAAFDDPLLIDKSSARSHPTGMKFTGQHALEGFCLMNGASNGNAATAPVAAKDLHRLMAAALLRSRERK